MTGEGFLLLAAILIGTPLAIVLAGILFDWWIHRTLKFYTLTYNGLADLRRRLIEREG